MYCYPVDFSNKNNKNYIDFNNDNNNDKSNYVQGKSNPNTSST